MSESCWHTVCVYYYDERGHDDLILDAVRPLFTKLSEIVAAAYFARHWRRGPHVRLNFHTSGEVLRRTVLSAIDDTVGAFLYSHPSRSTVDPPALRDAHRTLARAERDDGPLWPWRPDNSVH